jgi:predicted nucleic acid-binding protein
MSGSIGSSGLIVPDASVVVKWFLGDEDDGDRALAIRQAITAERLRAVAPSSLPWEFAQALIRASRRGRLDETRIEAAVRALGDFGIDLLAPWRLEGVSAALALQLGVSIYDAGYLAAARESGATLVTADRRQRDAALKAEVDMAWLGDVPV